MEVGNYSHFHSFLYIFHTRVQAEYNDKMRLEGKMLIKLAFCYTISLVLGSTLRPGFGKIFEGRQVIECTRKTFTTGTERLR